MSALFLLVDDDDAFRAVMTRALERRGYAVVAAADGPAALSCALQRQPDYCVLDLRLAQESGLQLLPDLLENAPRMRTVVLTGFASIATAVEAVKRGAVNYLSKPAALDDILKALEDANEDELPDIEAEPMSVDRLEWEHIHKVLAEHEGNISATARSLGMHRRTLQRKLQKHPVKR